MDIISANLNIPVHTKHNATKRTQPYSIRNKIHFGLFFVVEGSLAEDAQNLQFL